jgi:hypothetical protein
MWHIAEGVQLRPAVEDTFRWRWSPAATYSARSAYRLFFAGSTQFAAAKPIWKAWAPLKVKLFMWLAVRGWLWRADRRLKRGLQGVSTCPLCDQEPETADHLFCSCSYTRQVWHIVLTILGPSLGRVLPAQTLELWLQLRAGLNAELHFHAGFLAHMEGAEW